MKRVIVLDSAVLGWITNPGSSSESDSCKQWAKELKLNKDIFVVTEIVDYEVRRELLRRNAQAGLRNLDEFERTNEYIKLDTATMHLAAALWAQARSRGHVTAGTEGLDADVILVAQSIIAVQSLSEQIPDLQLIVATTNSKHLAFFLDARAWRDIPAKEPQEGVTQ